MNRLTLTLIFIFAAIAVGGLAIFLFMPPKVQNKWCGLVYAGSVDEDLREEFEEKIKAGNCEVIRLIGSEEIDWLTSTYCNFDKAIIKINETEIQCVPLNK